MLCQIRQCYVEMDKFWSEEICRAANALERRRVDPSDVERWKNFCASLKETIDSWKVYPLYFRYAFPTYQNTFFRIGRQVVVPKTYATTIHALPQFVHSSSYFGTPKFGLILSRERTSGGLPHPYHPQWARSKRP